MRFSFLFTLIHFVPLHNSNHLLYYLCNMKYDEVESQMIGEGYEFGGINQIDLEVCADRYHYHRNAITLLQ